MYCASFVGIPSSCQVLLFFSSRPSSSKGKRKEKKTMPTREEKSAWTSVSLISRSLIDLSPSDFNWPKWDLSLLEGGGGGGGQKRAAEYRIVPLKLISIRRPCPWSVSSSVSSLAAQNLTSIYENFPFQDHELYSPIFPLGFERR